MYPLAQIQPRPPLAGGGSLHLGGGVTPENSPDSLSEATFREVLSVHTGARGCVSPSQLPTLKASHAFLGNQCLLLLMTEGRRWP